MEKIRDFFGFGQIFFYLGLFVFLYLSALIFKGRLKRLKSAFYMGIFSLLISFAPYFSSFLPQKALYAASVAASLFAAFSVLTILASLFFHFISDKAGIEISSFAQDMITAALYLIASLAVLSAYGANLSGILTTSAVLTGVIAFSIQDTLTNIIGGTVIHLENSFKPGDMIEIDGKQGILKELRWRYATLETLDGDLLIIPNIMLMKGVVNVMGKAAGNVRFREVYFNVFYEVPPGKVISIVEKAFMENSLKNVSSLPAPYCAVKEFQPNCVVYALRYYLSDLSSPGKTDSDVRIKIYYALAREGIELFVANRSIVTSEAAKEFKENKEKEEFSKRISSLKKVDIFKPLKEEEFKFLAASLKVSPFSDREVIMKRGEKADCLYLISEGQANIILGEGQDVEVLKTLSEGEFMGEMGLLTGEPRSATAVSLGETICYRLDKKDFSVILSSRPEIAESLAEILASRKNELEKAKEKIKLGASVSNEGVKSNMLLLIKRFFEI